MPVILKNNAFGFLGAAINNSDTVIILQSGLGANFPTLSTNEYFYATISPISGASEIVKVTARSGDSLTVVRAQEGTSALSFSAGSRIELRVTAGSVEDYVEQYAELGVYTPTGSNAVPTTVQTKLRETVSVKDFGAVGDGVADDTAAIQAAIDAHRGKIFFPIGTYVISSTIIVKPERILIGEGAGAYFQGSGYDRMTCFKPTAGFVGNDVFRADPADAGPGLVYVFGIAMRDLLIDCINIKNAGKTIIKLLSLSNSETFDSVRIINNNTNIAIHIGLSANSTAFLSDGLSFNNIYCLQCDVGGTTTNPVLLIDCANEISFRDSKFQRGNDETVADGKAVFINSLAGGIGGQNTNAITLESCSFTGAENGVLIQGNATDGGGPRWIRIQNGTFEGPKYGITAVGTPFPGTVQFCTFGPGNRFFAGPPGSIGVRLLANANNNTVFADEFTPVEFGTNSVGNMLYNGGAFTNNGTSNARVFRSGAAVRLNRLFIESNIGPTLLNGWSNAANRETAGYRKDDRGFVYLKGTLTGGTYGAGAGDRLFNLPAGYRPFAAVVFAVPAGGAFGEVIIDGNGDVFPAVGSGNISIDGISFISTS